MMPVEASTRTAIHGGQINPPVSDTTGASALGMSTFCLGTAAPLAGIEARQFGVAWSTVVRVVASRPATEPPTPPTGGGGMTEAQAWKGKQIATGWRKLVDALRDRGLHHSDPPITGTGSPLSALIGYRRFDSGVA